MLLEVGGHGRVAAQSLTWALQASVALYDPRAATGIFPQHAAAAGGRWDSVGAHRQAFGRLAGRGEVRVLALKHTADVIQEVAEELWNPLITWEHKLTQTLRILPQYTK